jgi:malonate-semialdehyde dehydrogenase (acetylating)/methylmalonate-semialdehyde dehydrogenase
VTRAPDYKSAVGLINDHEFGDRTAILNHDSDAAREFAAKIHIGMVCINVPIPPPMAFHLFQSTSKSSAKAGNLPSDVKLERLKVRR